MVRCQYNWVWRPQEHRYENSKADRNSSWVITNLTSDVIKETDERIRAIEHIRLDNFRSAAFEIGFLNYVILESYRRMIETYNVTVEMGDQLYGMEVVLYLYDIENTYWHIDHLINMQHEIERKYRIVSNIRASPDEVELLDLTADPNMKIKKSRHTRDRLGEQIDAMMGRLSSTKKKSTRWWWPIEYGWEIDYYW
ncbi:hypothetical protein ABMA27_012371 [Loxostege sticticalis]|uniref:Uncharacterized protein n=1 Tax=Loxostege sticticalis TaxID=481309 RepID=A0ABR3H1E3_LOXSC